jgi:hypothetical protein
VIKLHEFNTRWWGRPVGIVTDLSFFSLPQEERKAALAPFQWVEFKSTLRQALPLQTLMEAGFFLTDIQVEFRIALSRIAAPDCCGLSLAFADEEPIALSDTDLAHFEHERHLQLPGTTPESIRGRYATWARQLIDEHPDTCLSVRQEGKVQGWFLSQPAPFGLNLTLAMLHRSATMSGYILYQAALHAYGERGHHLGGAGFSVTNTATHNIYSALGARWVSPVGIWFWIAGDIDIPHAAQ